MNTTQTKKINNNSYTDVFNCFIGSTEETVCLQIQGTSFFECGEICRQL